jgi:DNA-binding XRE family transcriptional regulator
MVKSYDFKELLGRKMRDPKFRREWESNSEEFELAKAIIQLRIKAGMTQKALAQRAHTSQPSIARLESGSYHNLSLSFLRRVGGALHVKPRVNFEKLQSVH